MSTPSFPGYGTAGKKLPAPPKYLIKTGEDLQTEYVRVADDARKAIEPTKLPVINPGGLQPVPAKYTSSPAPVVSYNQPPHRYKGRVDSKSESKESRDEIPRYVGSTFTHLPNQQGGKVPGPTPLAPTVPRPYVSAQASDFANHPMLHNRTASGQILGGATKRHIDPLNVPVLTQLYSKQQYQPQAEVGPDNPVVQLNEDWTACWDAEAKAVYYFNQGTGEATWICPPI